MSIINAHTNWLPTPMFQSVLNRYTRTYLHPSNKGNLRRNMCRNLWHNWQSVYTVIYILKDKVRLATTSIEQLVTSGKSIHQDPHCPTEQHLFLPEEQYLCSYYAGFIFSVWHSSSTPNVTVNIVHQSHRNQGGRGGSSPPTRRRGGAQLPPESWQSEPKIEKSSSTPRNIIMFFNTGFRIKKWDWMNWITL